MKTTSIIVFLGVLFLGNTLYAQTLDESRVRILPTLNNDIVKVHYAIETKGPVKVKFITEAGVASFDKIKGGPFPNGLSKTYNVGDFNDQDYWVEITSPAGSLTYKVVLAEDKKTFTTQLEKITRNQDLGCRE